MDTDEAERLAHEWIEAWNAHDLERVLSHYADEVEFTSPFVAAVLGDAGGTVRGKPALRAYFARALERYPQLHFRLERALSGVSSVTLCYGSVNGLAAAEVMEVDGAGRIVRVQCHYAPR
jgi:hypothetical protein